MPQKFIRKIVAHPGIGFLVVKDGTKIRLISKKGQMIIENNVITGKDFISHLGDVRIITNQIKNLSKMKNVGDLVVFGNYDGKRVVSFVDNFGTHSGLGGEQSNAFFISKNKVDLSKETSSKVLHKLFSAY